MCYSVYTTLGICCCVRTVHIVIIFTMCIVFTQAALRYCNFIQNRAAL